MTEIAAAAAAAAEAFVIAAYVTLEPAAIAVAWPPAFVGVGRVVRGRVSRIALSTLPSGDWLAAWAILASHQVS